MSPTSVSLPVHCRPAAYDAFASHMPDVETAAGLFRAAFAISLHELPHGRVDSAERVVAELARTVRRRVRSSTAEALLAHLHDVLFDVVGMRGNVENYYSSANSYVGEVLRTGCGIPITLVLVYKSVADQLGLTVHGINAPGHFLAGVESGSASSDNVQQDNDAQQKAAPLMYVDPFYGGGLLQRHEVFKRVADTTGRPVPNSPALLSRATHRQWLARMLNNLQVVFASTGRERDVYAMQELQELL